MRYLEFLGKGTEYVIAGQRTGQALMNAYRDLVEPWEKLFEAGTLKPSIVTESGVELPDVWEISGEHPDLEIWFTTAEEKCR